MTTQEMTRLRTLVLEAQAMVNRPFEPGETARPVTFLTNHLVEEGWTLGWSLVAALRETRPDLFELYGENSLHLHALDLVRDAPGVPSLEDIASGLLSSDGAEDGTWLIAVPLANVAMDRSWAPAGPDAALRRAWDVDADPLAPRERFAGDQETVQAEFDVMRHLGDRIGAPTRYYHLEQGVEDTKRTASLLILEAGARHVAVEKAISKAHYVVAVWSVLSPPEEGELLPETAVWAPQPDHRQDPPHKRFEKGVWMAKERRHGAIWHWSPYPLPGDDVLAGPFKAFEWLDRRCAQALLSAASAFYSAEQGAMLSDRILDIRRAIECLCEPADRSDSEPRWEKLASRFDVWNRLEKQRAYTPDRVTALQERIRDARNISMHGADAAKLDLGWTGGDRPLKRGRTASAGDLSLSALSRDLSPMLFAVGEALKSAWLEMGANDFDDAAFEALFA